MKRKYNNYHTSIECNPTEIGESIEEKCRRIVENNEPITDGAPLIYTERKEGVLPQYDIRTDRWDLAQTAMDKVTASITAQREQNIKPLNETKEA